MKSRSIYLMVRDQDHPLWEVELDKPILRPANLPRHRLIPTDAHRRWSPNIGHEARCQSKVFLRHGHVGVVPLLVDKIERRAYHLGCKSPWLGQHCTPYRAGAERDKTYTMIHVAKKTAKPMSLTICIEVP